MARTILIWGPTGLATPTCKLMLRSSPLVLVETITLTEHADIKRAYTGTVTAAAGKYKYNLLNAGAYVGGGSIYVGATDGILYEEDNSIDWANIQNPTAIVDLSGTTISDGSGSGARTVTITVTDSLAAAIQNANVRFTLGGSTYSQTTGVTGILVFNLDDGTWTVSITAVGYSFTGTTLVVNGTETATYTLTSNAPSPPSNPLLSTGYVYCYDINGVVESGVVITCQMETGPGTAGYSHDSAPFDLTSDVDGLASHSGLVRGATYGGRRGNGKKVTFLVPNSGTFLLPETLGRA